MASRSETSILVYATQMLSTGGIESHITSFISQLKSKNNKIDLIILNDLLTNEDRAKIKLICRNFYSFPANKNKVIRHIWLTFLFLFIRWRKYQAVYTNGQGKSIYFISKFFPKNSHWVHHHHTAGDAEDRLLWPKQYKKVMQKAKIIIACSRKNANDLQLYLEREIQSIPCFSRAVNKIKNNTSENEYNLKFGFYGRLIPEKGIDVICKLSNDPTIKNIEFHIWGEGSHYSKLYFNKYPNIYYHGSFKGENELKEVIQKLDAYMLFSKHAEGLPISLLEVMSAGIPWVATNRGGISDIAFNDKWTKLIQNPEDYDEITNAVKTLADNIYSDNEYFDILTKNYEQYFSPEVVVKLWQEKLNIS